MLPGNYLLANSSFVMHLFIIYSLAIITGKCYSYINSKLIQKAGKKIMKKIAMSLLLGVILVLFGNSQPRGAVADTKSLIADGMAAGSLKPYLETLPDYIPYQEIP